MKSVYFEEGQQGDEWLTWRQNGIGASDIGIILGSNKYKTILSLWDDKCGFGEPTFVTDAMKHGIENEARARNWINEHHKMNLKPVCIEDIEKTYFKASLDGYESERKILAEIKCPLSHNILDKARENQSIPLYWQHQIQWQIMLCNPIRAFLAIWDYRVESCFTVEAFAQPTLQKEMKEKAEEFWRRVRIGSPPPPSNKDYIHVEDENLKALLEEFNDHNTISKAAEIRKKELKKEILKFGNNGNFTSYGYFISRCSPRKTYDINQMEMDGINIDNYIKKNTGDGFYKISCPKD